MTTWAKRRDELERTTFAGQIALDGEVVEQDVVRPVVPDVREVDDEVPGDAVQPALFGQ